MDWLSPSHTIPDYHANIVTLAMPGFPMVEWRGSLDYVPSRVISYLKAQQMVEKGCLVYLAFVRDVGANTFTIESVPVVRDFMDEFPIDLPVMPPDRDIDCGIDFVPGTQPISIPPYHMAPVELKELKEKLQEILDKGFIRPSVSPWGAPILFMKKKDERLAEIYIREIVHLHSVSVSIISDQGEVNSVWLRTKQSAQKSYADKKARDVTYIVDEKVLLRVSSMKGMMRFRKKGKLSPRYIGPFEMLEKVGEVTYRLVFPPSLSGVHPVFHVSMLQKYYVDLSHVLDFSTVQLNKDLTYDVEPISILDR
ncbi:uncharacterized protein [Nicotiana tomentosiformis]|uniref:uncharacterized protein n=1 Tax=Nicotiana tomentosiformis TaxID=4098 RepID=UPI00388C8EF1